MTEWESTKRCGPTATPATGVWLECANAPKPFAPNSIYGAASPRELKWSWLSRLRLLIRETNESQLKEIVSDFRGTSDVDGETDQDPDSRRPSIIAPRNRCSDSRRKRYADCWGGLEWL